MKGEKVISKYECYDRFFKIFFSYCDDYQYMYDCPLCRNCPFFGFKYGNNPCKLYSEKLTGKLNQSWNDIKVLVESAYSE